MTLPALSKTWQYGTANNRVNQRIVTVSATADRASLLWTIKDSMVDAAFTSPWLVRGSSTGAAVTACPADPATVVAAGANDRWASSANLTWTASASRAVTRSWIVLRQAGIGPRYEVLFDLVQAVGFANSVARPRLRQPRRTASRSRTAWPTTRAAPSSPATHGPPGKRPTR